MKKEPESNAWKKRKKMAEESLKQDKEIKEDSKSWGEALLSFWKDEIRDEKK